MEKKKYGEGKGGKYHGEGKIGAGRDRNQRLQKMSSRTQKDILLSILVKLTALFAWDYQSFGGCIHPLNISSFEWKTLNDRGSSHRQCIYWPWNIPILPWWSHREYFTHSTFGSWYQIIARIDKIDEDIQYDTITKVKILQLFIKWLFFLGLRFSFYRPFIGFQPVGIFWVI